MRPRGIPAENSERCVKEMIKAEACASIASMRPRGIPAENVGSRLLGVLGDQAMGCFNEAAGNTRGKPMPTVSSFANIVKPLQ